jgi:hypothetical protein
VNEFTDPWTNDVLDEFGALLGTGRAEPAIDAFMAFTTGPSRTLDDVDPDVVRRLYEMMRTSPPRPALGRASGSRSMTGGPVLSDGRQLPR